VQHAAKVVAVEIDKNLVAQLSNQHISATNFVLYQNDILKVAFEDILPGEQRWKAVANLPYHITSPVLFKLFEQRHFFESATLMVQKEVAQRMVAKPSTKAYGILSVFSQYYAETKILFDVSKHVFFPKPDVTSAVVRLEFNKPGLLDEYEEPVFRQVVRGTFNQRRKMLRNSLLAIPDLDLDLDKINFDLKQRPEQLSVSDFIALTKQIVGQIDNLSCR
jgi:16S rRNA (adenine1518-N6/adenine1519-N6)-dimethyltransferase